VRNIAEIRASEDSQMIARIWQGRTRPGMGRAYFEYLEQTGLKEYKATEGFKDVLVLTREVGDQTEYVLITLWENMDAVRRFAGPEPERAVYYPNDERYFSKAELTPQVRHYNVHAAPAITQTSTPHL
jgi:heme-degrading monooxygenase HmoA